MINHYLVKIIILAAMIIPLFTFGFELNLDYPIFRVDLNQVQDLGFSGLMTWLYYGILIISVGAAFGILIYGGIEYMTSAGDPRKMKSGISRIQDVAIGILLITISYLTLYTINPRLLSTQMSSLPELASGDPINFPPLWTDLCFLFPEICDYGEGNVGDFFEGNCDDVPPDQLIPYGIPIEGGGIITQVYKGGAHKGMDFISSAGGRENSYGVTICSMAVGTVESAVNSNRDGMYVIINHPGGYRTRYFHLMAFGVTSGEQIPAGKGIGGMGNTGNCRPMPTPEDPFAGTHLHYEIWKDGSHTDPYPYIAAQ